MLIEVVSGSPRKESLTFPLAQFLQRQLQEKSSRQVGLLDVREYPLPPIQKVFTSIENTPEKFKSLARRMFAADAFVMVTPEYNGSYSSALKNMFDHFPMQEHKAFGIVTASPGAMGGMRASQQMQLFISAFLGIFSPHMLITPQVHEKFSPSGELLDPSFQSRVDTFIDEFIWLTERLKAKQERQLPFLAGSVIP